MIHYLVVTGNEFGPTEREPFTDLQKAIEHYESVKNDDFHAGLIQINEDEKEIVLRSKTDGVETPNIL